MSRLRESVKGASKVTGTCKSSGFETVNHGKGTREIVQMTRLGAYPCVKNWLCSAIYMYIHINKYTEMYIHIYVYMYIHISIYVHV